MTNLKKLKTDYQRGLIKKADYIKEMYSNHRYLFDYCTFLEKTDISKIEITDSGVTMTIRNTGIKMLCPRDDYRIAPIEILNFSHYEKTEMEMLLKLVKKGFTIFDIGANIGWYTLNISRLTGVKVIAFEPVPQTFAYLRKNLKLNDIDNAEIYNIGFSDKEGKIAFYFYPQGSVNASAANLTLSKDAKKIFCRVEKIDEFVKRKKMKIDLMKCDVEGAELFVFRGAVKTISRDKPIIFTEMLRKWAAPFHYHPNEIIKLLASCGYRCFTIVGRKLKEFYKMDEKTIETNFIFLHGEKHSVQIRRFRI